MSNGSFDALFLVVATLIACFALYNIGRAWSGWRSRRRLLRQELTRLGTELPAFDVPGLIATEPDDDPDRPAKSRIAHHCVADTHVFTLPNMGELGGRVRTSAFAFVVMALMALVIIAIWPALFSDAEQSGQWGLIALPLVWLALVYMFFRLLREALILSHGDRYLVLNGNFLVFGRVYRFLGDERAFSLRHLKDMAPYRGASRMLRLLARVPPAMGTEFDCLSFMYDGQRVVIPGVGPSEVRWLKTRIEHIAQGA